jgi:CcmD family protein
MRRVVPMNSGNRGVGCGGRRGALPLGLALIIAVAIACVAPSWAEAQPEPVNEFVPIDELPEEDRLPAAPFLITAYSIVWILAFGYFWLLSRRQADVERDLAELARRRPVQDDDDPLEAA